EQQVIKHRFHSLVVRGLDIAIYCSLIVSSSDQIRPTFCGVFWASGKGFLMIVFPVVELYTIDMKTTQVLDIALDRLVRETPVIGNKTISRKFRPFRRHIDGHTVQRIFLWIITFVDIYQITFKVIRWRCPSPRRACKLLFF